MAEMFALLRSDLLSIERCVLTGCCLLPEEDPDGLYSASAACYLASKSSYCSFLASSSLLTLAF